jgi:tRNA pseudouridine38-40 synthase
VQETIEGALSKINRNQKVGVIGCGRTDTGVHAADYLLHFDFPEVNELDQFVYKLNKMLPPDISIMEMQEVSADFHARFDAQSRTYRYFIHAKKNSFKYEQSYYLPIFIDIDTMNQAANLLLGQKDFTSFSKLHTDAKTNICTITKAEWVRVNDYEFYFEITADRFLRNMVRAIVGTLLDVGVGKLKIEDINQILASKNRCEASTSVPGHALFLWKIAY